MTQNTEQDRAEFEARFKHLDLTQEPDAWGEPQYKHDAISLAWGAWQAARHPRPHHTNRSTPCETLATLKLKIQLERKIMFVKDQKVWCLIYGQGVVAEVDGENACGFGISVKFNDDFYIDYTSDGKYCVEGNVTLFPHPVEVIKSLTKPSIDWSHVSSEYNYLVQDSDGEGYLCSEEPSRVKSGWNAGSPNISATTFTSYEPGTCGWKESLVERPE